MMHLFKKTNVHLALIALAGIIVYSNTIHNPFLFDDPVFVTNNPALKNFSFFFDPAKVKEISQQYLPALDSYFKTRYITFLTFAVNYAIHGNNVPGYHFVNIAFHIFNAFLLYALMALIYKTPLLARILSEEYKALTKLFTALLFVCHPVQTQAVTYLWQRSTSLATLFYLASVVLYVRCRLSSVESSEPPGAMRLRASFLKPLVYYIAALLSAVLAMKTKEIAFTLPVAIAACEFLFFRSRLANRLLYLLPVFLTMSIIPLSILGMETSFKNLLGDVSSSTRVMSDISRWDYLLTQFSVVTTYLRLIFWPANQNVDYDYPVFRSFFTPEVSLSFLVLLALFGTGIYLWARFREKAPQTRLISFGIFWFFITLSVESSIIPIIDVIFEHRVYLPSVGIFIASVTVLFLFSERLKPRFNHALNLTAIVLSAAVLIFSFAAHQRNLVWGSEVSLWEDNALKSPRKSRVLNNLGVAYQKNNELQKALEMYSRAISANPPYTYAYYNLGYIYFMLGDAVQENYNLALYYFSEGHVEQAIENFTKAIELNREFAAAYYYRGQVYYVVGQYDKAKADFQASCNLGIQPGCKSLNAITK